MYLFHEHFRQQASPRIKSKRLNEVRMKCENLLFGMQSVMVLYNDMLLWLAILYSASSSLGMSSRTCIFVLMYHIYVEHFALTSYT